ncbi:MAG: hypothetical protein JSV12_08280 [Candidatus Bathyarchaeota archaeon]|nr:MAG: hypothetical protein JSV12_08280 [Candidatus Bathyarchaeota archaeon]
MFPYTFEAVTAITITALSVITAIYIVVLKKRGWLKKETPPESFFLCPNPKCEKIFQKPMKLTVLSETPPREHSACPHCGVILTALLSKKKPKLTVETSLRREKPKTKIEDLLDREKYPKLKRERKIATGNQETKTLTESTEISDTSTVVDTPKPPEESHEYRKLQHPQAKPLSTEQVEGSEEELPTISSKNIPARPQECPHYFGYLKAVPKNSSIPEECLCCPEIMECLTLRVIPEQTARAK